MKARYGSQMRFFAAIVIAGLLGSLGLAPARAAQDVRTVRLFDQRGVGLTLNGLRGTPVLVTFVATRCTDACPIATALFGKVRERLHREHIAATLLEVTLDPKYDTPFAMARYARAYGAASTPDWRFASGPRPAVEAWMRAFDVSTSPDKQGVPEEHSSFVYLIDKRGRVTSTLLLSTNLTDEVVRKLTHPAA